MKKLGAIFQNLSPNLRLRSRHAKIAITSEAESSRGISKCRFKTNAVITTNTAINIRGEAACSVFSNHCSANSNINVHESVIKKV